MSTTGTQEGLGDTPGQYLGAWSPESVNEQHIKDLVIDLTPDSETRAGRDMGLHVIDGNDPHADIGRYVEWYVFNEKFGNDLDQMKDEYGPYDQASVFLVVLDYAKQKPAAVLRLIKPNSATGLKSIKDLLNSDLEKNPWYDPADTTVSLLSEIGDTTETHTVDVSTMAVMPEYRSAHSKDAASAVLYSSCVRWSLEKDYNYWITIVDERILAMMQDWGEPFITFPGKSYAPYLGSEASRPMHTELYSGLKKVKEYDLARQRDGKESNIHGLYTRGSGLDSIFVIPNFTLPDNL